jgi:hypothetical protein
VGFASRLLQPDTAAGVLLDQWHAAKILFFVKRIDEGIEQLNLELLSIIEYLESLMG